MMQRLATRAGVLRSTLSLPSASTVKAGCFNPATIEIVRQSTPRMR